MTLVHAVDNRPVVDVDNPVTWPRPLADLIYSIADKTDLEEPELYVDLVLGDREVQVLDLLRGHLLRAQHCTRLLDHEADAIRAHGLRPLDVTLVDDRLNQAHERGYLTAAEREVLRSQSMVVPGRQRLGNREDQVCLTLSAEATSHDINGVWRLLSFWGGEAIYWRHCDDHAGVAQRLRSLGRPTLVTAYVDLASPGRHLVFKSVVHTFVGKAIGYAPANADILYRNAIPPQHIESVAFPGDPAYDRLAGLPTS
ncbi:hypothetical protein N8I84_41590 (plasmid) [Streptomyces cynarae]|uniref:Uncharacterized protein n=1 Tax=Streptomyces cynarae TaxID=2981134 RepID=A0ABY6EE10_9ACTN|nr:hypothetical protein [Streptomyces cynarae]UXY24937.1 hypothetical protein N8I84_41590 [Streptomyces cynarae]